MVQIKLIDKNLKVISGTYDDNAESIEMLKCVIKGVLFNLLGLDNIGNYYDEWERLNIGNGCTGQIRDFNFEWHN
jgi:hypothetical protein